MRGDRSPPIMKIAASKNQERILVVPAAIFKSEPPINAFPRKAWEREKYPTISCRMGILPVL